MQEISIVPKKDDFCPPIPEEFLVTQRLNINDLTEKSTNEDVSTVLIGYERWAIEKSLRIKQIADIQNKCKESIK